MFRQELDGCLGRNLQHPVPADKYRKEDGYATILMPKGEGVAQLLGPGFESRPPPWGHLPK
jgi:hypothetical protein